MPIPVTTTRRSAMWRDVEVAKVRVWETEDDDYDDDGGEFCCDY